jgi:DNA-directed RNA polymerase specialized sigma24 family protein
MEGLYAVLSKGIRFFLCRELGTQDLDDRVRDVFILIIQAIQRGAVRRPECLMGFVWTVTRRQPATYIGARVFARRFQASASDNIVLRDGALDPERQTIKRQDTELALRILNGLSKRDREVQVRFYLNEQAPEQICREMNLTATQFRLTKSRAKAHFGELGKARVSRRVGFAAKSQQRHLSGLRPACA